MKAFIIIFAILTFLICLYVASVVRVQIKNEVGSLWGMTDAR